MDKPDESLPPLNLPVQPPVEPMLAQLTRDMPSGGGWLHQPKWDGFRTLVFWDGEQLVLQGRDLGPLGRYLAELETGLRDNLRPGAVVDGEVVIAGPNRLDLEVLLQQIGLQGARLA